MSYGALIHNSGGDTLIDSGVRNYKQLDTGTMAPSSTAYDYLLSLSGSPIAPLIAASPQDRYASFHATFGSPSFTQARLWQEKGVGSLNIPWVSHAPNNATLSGSHGVFVKDAAGDEVFDSRASYLDIIDVVSAANTLTTSVSSTQTVTHTSLSNAYYSLNSMRSLLAVYVGPWGPDPSFNIYDEYMRGIKQISATQAQVGWFYDGRFITLPDTGSTANVMFAMDLNLYVCTPV